MGFSCKRYISVTGYNCTNVTCTGRRKSSKFSFHAEKLTIRDMIHLLKNHKPRSKIFRLGEAPLVFME